ncbi:MAG TPA: group II truncated hemoglobin [Candidatus Competibacteraceae bacterium]|nr:group II truncated hemoglobin [Candidatus Competibacteraceae bacterium]
MPSTPYERLGGAERVRELVDRFYDLMDTLPEARGIRSMHPPSLAGSRDKLYEFLCGWLGGPQLYIERHGHPRLRARHLPFPIGAAERDQWLTCMYRALDELAPDDPLLRQQLRQSFFMTAEHMRNRPEPSEAA